MSHTKEHQWWSSSLLQARASLRALTATISSTAVTEEGKGNAFAMEATTCRFQSQIMTPTLVVVWPQW